MSTRTIQASSEPTHLPRPKNLCEREFEEFLEHAAGGGSADPLSLRAWIDLAEAWKITRTLRTCRGNRSAAARALGIGRRTLYAKMEKLQIAPRWAMGSERASAADRG